MTELERWLSKYGKANTVATKKQSAVNNTNTSNRNNNTSKSSDYN